MSYFCLFIALNMSMIYQTHSTYYNKHDKDQHMPYLPFSVHSFWYLQNCNYSFADKTLTYNILSFNDQHNSIFVLINNNTNKGRMGQWCMAMLELYWYISMLSFILQRILHITTKSKCWNFKRSNFDCGSEQSECPKPAPCVIPQDPTGSIPY